MSEPVRKNKKASNDWLIGQQVDRYHILHRLAAGGMGAVYVARAVGMGGFERLVALKVLHPHLADEEEFITMLLDEARLAARIRHPNVVATLDVSQWEDLHYLVMDYVEGDHLAGLLSRPYKQGLRLPLRPALRIIYEALAGLTAAHELLGADGESLNLVHRDVSPQNILVGVDGISRLTDFGVAKAEYRLSSTRQGTFKGKLAYTAPETASQAHAEQRSDLFAMGVVLWEVLTTKRLFKAETNIATLRKLLDDPIPLPSSVDPELQPFDAVLAKALARPLEERFQSGAEMMEAIERAAASTVGMGTARDVSELVRTYADTKLEKERISIKSAITKLGGDDPKAYTTGRHDAIEDDDAPRSQPPTVAAKSISELIDIGPEPLEKKGPSPAVWAGGAVLVLGLAIGITWWLTSTPPATPAPTALPPVAVETGVETSEAAADDEPGAENDAPADDPSSDDDDGESADGVANAGQSDAPDGERDGDQDGADGVEPTAAGPAMVRDRNVGMRRGGAGMRPRMDDDDDVLSNPYR